MDLKKFSAHLSAVMALIIAFVLIFSVGTVSRAQAEEPGRLFFIGDSRTVGMYHSLYGGSSDPVNASDGSEVWIGKISSKYSWMEQIGVPEAERYGIRKTDTVFVLMGVNDCQISGQAERYASYLKSKQKVWGCRVFFVSVNPVNESLAEARYPGYPQFRNPMINSFNSIMKNALNGSTVQYLDTNSDMASSISASGTTTDGVHYTNPIYKNWYNLIIKKSGTISITDFSSSAGTYLKANEETVLSASASGGSGEYTYKFIVYNKNTRGWFKIRDFAPEKTCTWNAGPFGEKQLFVDVKDSNGLVRRRKLDVAVQSILAETPMLFNSEGQPVTSVAAASRAFIGVKASGTGTVKYKFIVYNSDNGSWYKIRDWDTDGSAVWWTGCSGNKIIYADAADSTGQVVRRGVSVHVR